MRVAQHSEPQSLTKEDVARRIRDMVFAADDVSDPALGVVDDDDQVEDGLGHAARDHEIAELGGVELDLSADQIVKDDFLVRILEADDFSTTTRFLGSFF